MDILGLRQEVPQDPVGQVLTHEQYGQVAVVTCSCSRVWWIFARTHFACI